ncbi:MAG: cytochrome c biogenesis protein CcdA [Chloroflexota bacterium]|nr:cytochrome c biogenesis protein CcdA [Chloroflexota bacterium]
MRTQLVPFIIGGLAIIGAIVGALLTGTGSDATGGINEFIESLSGGSGSRLSKIGFLGFTFSAGMVSTVNPCGFAMLPAYLAIYLGAPDSREEPAKLIFRFKQAFLVGTLISLGVMLLFGTVGAILAAGITTVRTLIPWLGLAIGASLSFGGAWVLMGGNFNIGAISRAASRMGDAREVSLKSYFLFGLSYGTASLSCTLPVFIAVVGFGTTTTFLTSMGYFLLYGFGMGFVILTLTLIMSIFKIAMVGVPRRLFPHIQPISAILMILAGSYIVYYWFTLGRDLL